MVAAKKNQVFILPLGVLEAYESLYSALRNTAYEDDDGIETVGSISKKSIVLQNF